jgi:hypothetical protein
MQNTKGLFGRDSDSPNSDLLIWIHQKFPKHFFFHQIRIHQIGDLEARFTNFVKLLKRCSTEFRFTVDLIHGESQIQIHFL